MSEKTRKNNDREDELNQSRFFAERGAQAIDTEEPGGDGIELEEEDIADSKSRFREQPAKIRPESKIADESPFYGQGFENDDADDGIRREAEPDDPSHSDLGEDAP